VVDSEKGKGLNAIPKSCGEEEEGGPAISGRNSVNDWFRTGMFKPFKETGGRKFIKTVGKERGKLGGPTKER